MWRCVRFCYRHSVQWVLCTGCNSTGNLQGCTGQVDSVDISSHREHGMCDACQACPHGRSACAQVLKTLKFGIGDGRLRYYLYNWRVPAELQPSDVGLVLL